MGQSAPAPAPYQCISWWRERQCLVIPWVGIRVLSYIHTAVPSLLNSLGSTTNGHRIRPSASPVAVVATRGDVRSPAHVEIQPAGLQTAVRWIICMYT